MISESVLRRADGLFESHLEQTRIETNRLFLRLFLVQWVFAVILAIALSPYAWDGHARSIHIHVQLALLGGLALNTLPAALIVYLPTWTGTRHVVAATQMLWSALFVHLTGGRIETHFHIFGSLAFLAFYRDPRVLLTATLVVAADHLFLGFFDPASVYGVTNPEWWRFLEHGGWVLFEDIVLIVGCRRQLGDKHILALREAVAEQHLLHVEQEVTLRTQELEASGQRLRCLLENTSAVPWELDASNGRIVYIAPAIAAIGGVSEGSIEPGHSFLALLHVDDREDFHQYLQAAAANPSKRMDAIDSRIISPGRSMAYLRSFVAVQSGPGRSDTVRGISIDVTKQKQLELELLQAHKLESIGHLAAGIAHEINTPTQFIGDNIRFLSSSFQELMALLDAAARGDDIAQLLDSADTLYLRQEMPRALSQTLDGVERIAAIVGAMKDFSHPALDKTPCDLNRAIESTITVARNEWKYVADVQTHLDPELPYVSVMPSAFNQVILNLLVNAAHAIAANPNRAAEEKGRIAISTFLRTECVEIRIEDSGCGISADILDRIFDPFFTTKEVGKGTGQGLALSRDVIVNKHGGRIEVKSEPGKGTIFIIELPLDRESRPEVVEA